METQQILQSDLKPGMVVEWKDNSPGVVIRSNSGGLYLMDPEGKGIPLIDYTPYKKWTLWKNGKKVLESITDIHKSSFVLNVSSYAGTDPEVFAVDAKGQVIPAFEYLPEKKDALKIMNKSVLEPQIGTAFYDGFQAEFTIGPITCH